MIIRTKIIIKLLSVTYTDPSTSTLLNYHKLNKKILSFFNNHTQTYISQKTILKYIFHKKLLI